MTTHTGTNEENLAATLVGAALGAGLGAHWGGWWGAALGAAAGGFAAGAAYNQVWPVMPFATARVPGVEQNGAVYRG